MKMPQLGTPLAIVGEPLILHPVPSTWSATSEMLRSLGFS
jgi:hypothetical protein